MEIQEPAALLQAAHSIASQLTFINCSPLKAECISCFWVKKSCKSEHGKWVKKMCEHSNFFADVYVSLALRGLMTMPSYGYIKCNCGPAYKSLLLGW